MDKARRTSPARCLFGPWFALAPLLTLLLLAGCSTLKVGHLGQPRAAQSETAPPPASPGRQAPANSPPPAVAQYNLGVGGPEAVGRSGPPAPTGTAGLHAILETGQGTIEVEFYAADSPKAVENFRLLAERGYYNGLTFHRIVKGFMIQGGDPAGDGTGGVSAWGGMFDDNINPDSELYREGYRRGVLAMANAGPNTNGSQFFIMLTDYQLPPNYVIFGKVTKGMDVVDALGAVPTKPGPDGEVSRPVTPQVIRKVTILP
jgi:cyclophilin family peptidyl-prolyl cis-trans isomerase